jgi:hypothetical protein
MKPSSKSLIIVTAVLFAACSRNRPKTFAGPSRQNGLECALGAAASLGFQPERGGLSEGYVYLSRRKPNSAGEQAKEVATRIVTLGQKGVNRDTADRLNIVGAGSELRITASSLDEQGREVAPSDDAKRDSRAILQRCAP